MAAKKATVKAKAKRAAPKRKAKAPAKKGAAKAAPAKAKAKAKLKQKPATQPKQKAKPRTKPQKQPAAAPPDVNAADASAADAGESAEPAKKGPFARLADGVGNLFARVTGKKQADETDQVPQNDRTMEIASSDILPAEPPPIPKSKS